MVFKIGDIVRYSYNPRGYHTPCWYRARIIGIDETCYHLELLEFFGYWTERTIQGNREAIARASSLWELVSEETCLEIEKFKKKYANLEPDEIDYTKIRDEYEAILFKK